jgi:hypothetical protein
MCEPLTILDWQRATREALDLLRAVRTARLMELHPVTFSQAARLASQDEGCRLIDRARTVLEDQADGLTFLPSNLTLREHLGDIYDMEVTS